MALQTLIVNITGIRSVLNHNPTCVDPIAPETKELKKYTSIRNKTDETHEMIQRLEWEYGMYYDAEMGPYIPTRNLRACLIAGAKLSRGGKKVARAVSYPHGAKLHYEGPRDIEELYTATNQNGRRRFVDRAVVGVGTARVMRSRAIFRDWSLKNVTFLYHDALIDEAELMKYLEDAGTFEGICDGRQMGYGRFTVKKVKALKAVK